MTESLLLAGFMPTGTFIISVVALIIWRRIKQPKHKNQKADPMAEAEVYIAYGRKKKATEVLKKALLENPDCADIRKKLDGL